LLEIEYPEPCNQFDSVDLQDYAKEIQVPSGDSLSAQGGSERWNSTEHPAEKPETLLTRILLLATREGDTVLDPFMGSGTTGVVAKRLKRNFVGIEIDAHYYAIAKARIEGECGDYSAVNLFAGELPFGE